MMYLSLLKLTRAQSKQLKLTDTYSLHRIIYDCFPEQRADAQQPSGFLFCEIAGSALERRILILSEREPVASYDCTLHSKPLTDHFLSHASYRFEIVLNPVYRDSKSRKLIPLRTQADIIDWFTSRSARWGFATDAAQLELREIYVDQFTKKNNPVTLSKARLRGTLHITDRSLFKQALAAGLGRGKAFGCGLLQLSPLQS